MFARIKLALTIILIAALFVFIPEHGDTHTHHGYLYINVHAAASVENIGEDDIGEYTEYYVFGSTSLSTPSDIEGDDEYAGRCKQVLFVGLEEPYNETMLYDGETFISKVIVGTYKVYTAFPDSDTTFIFQEASAHYEVNGVILRTDHDHSASVTVPPGGSSFNEPW